MRSTPPPVLALLVVLSGCAPNSAERPLPTLFATRWTEESQPPAGAQPSRNLADQFGSAELGDAIREAHANNPDIAIAAARLSRAHGELKAAKAIVVPSAVLSATALGNGGSSEASGSSSLLLDYFLNPDLSGRRRALAFAARSRTTASEFDQLQMRLSVEVAVARTFIFRSVLAERLALVKGSAERSAELERIIRIRAREGEASQIELGLQVLQQRQFLDQCLSLEEALNRTRTALATLLGREAPGFSAPTSPLSGLLIPSSAIRSPNEVIALRPDIRAAEARIAQAGGNIAAARAAFMPSFSLGLSIVSSRGLGHLYAAGADVLAVIFDRDRLTGQLRVAESERAEAVEIYRRTMLAALAEVEDALSLSKQANAREALLRDAVAEARETADLARKQYIGGDADLQRVVEVEQRLAVIQDGWLLAKQAQFEAALALYLSRAQ